MKLVMVADGFEPASLETSGAWMAELALRLATRGHRITAISSRPSDPHAAPNVLPGVSVWHPPFGGLDDAIGSALTQRPDLVHITANAELDDVCVDRLLAATTLVDFTDFAAWCPAGDLEPRPKGGVCPRHHPDAACEACAGALRVRTIEPRFRLAREAQIAIAHSAFARDRAVEALERPVTLVPCGADPRTFSPEPASASTPEVAALVARHERPRVVLLGPPTPAHGATQLLDLFVAIAARVPETELVITGRDAADPDGPRILRSEAARMGLGEQVHWLPQLRGGDLPALLAASDVGLAPGLAPDPTGLSLARALAAGLAVVAHPAGAVNEVLAGGACGRLADARKPGAFADAVAALLTDSEARESLSAAARLAAFERFDLERSLFELEQLYERSRDRGRSAA